MENQNKKHHNIRLAINTGLFVLISIIFAIMAAFGGNQIHTLAQEEFFNDFYKSVPTQAFSGSDCYFPEEKDELKEAETEDHKVLFYPEFTLEDYNIAITGKEWWTTGEGSPENNTVTVYYPCSAEILANDKNTSAIRARIVALEHELFPENRYIIMFSFGTLSIVSLIAAVIYWNHNRK